MGNEIPTSSRVVVRARDGSRCVRCRRRDGGLQWHHRRPRAVNDDHQHCACVGILLCPTCHRWVHAHPMQARALGWIVSRHEAEPFTVPFSQPPNTWVLPDCGGGSRKAWAESLSDALDEFIIHRESGEVIDMRSEQ